MPPLTGATVAEVRKLGVRVVGDLADLDPVDVPGITPAEVDVALIAKAAQTALAASVVDKLKG